MSSNQHTDRFPSPPEDHEYWKKWTLGHSQSGDRPGPGSLVGGLPNSNATFHQAVQNTNGRSLDLPLAGTSRTDTHSDTSRVSLFRDDQSDRSRCTNPLVLLRPGQGPLYPNLTVLLTSCRSQSSQQWASPSVRLLLLMIVASRVCLHRRQAL